MPHKTQICQYSDTTLVNSVQYKSLHVPFIGLNDVRG